MTAVDLDALDKLRGALVAGPWRLSDGNIYRDGEHSNEPVAVGPWGGSIDAADAALIMAAVNAQPHLVATLRRVEALAEELGFLVDDETVDQVARVSHAWTLHRLRAALDSAP